ncbi:exodeoxyribonuclease III [Agromyces marinus]|uniref:Exodeoxyribonuclease III protein XthA n=1 Tax=Agromyces marinus TaxID=1389020 RepID=A0ABM8H2I1_9MICO|nr:exodeoxyribonuclease III [Agromyces marinus]UIP59908.1 Exodeoxyribonuclease III [Agromyces marinus]BDZ55000.1 putative exodeoxyribonuclease III protein XthA [Agromyces marinus]
MRIATWNVNSIRTRYGRVVDWMVREDVDVLAMQEIKCKPEQFPHDAFESAGYELAIHGLNQWNGVAIASRLPIADVETEFPGMPGFLKGHEGPELPKEARAIGATIDGVRLWSLYVPNGRSLGDPHYTYKLDWLAALTELARTETDASPERPFALMGDFNIAPFDDDNGDPTVVEGVTTHVSPAERAAFRELESAGLQDVVRPIVPTGFTYWDYKQLRFPRNEGLRIDFILGSASFAELVTEASIHRNERKGDAPSDHVPVLVRLDRETSDDGDLPMIFG